MKLHTYPLHLVAKKRFYHDYIEEKNVYGRKQRCHKCLTLNHSEEEPCPLQRISKNLKKRLEELVYSDIQLDRDEGRTYAETPPKFGKFMTTCQMAVQAY